VESEVADDVVDDSRDRRERTSKRTAGAVSRRPHVAVPRLAFYAIGTVTIVALAAAVAFGLAWSNLNSQNAERQAVKNVATTCLLDLTNFKPSTVDADLSALQTCAAPGSLFASQAAQTFSPTTRQALIQASATYEGQMRNIFVETLSASKAEVYAVLDTKYQNSKVNTPVVDTLRVTVDLVNTSQGWRISAITVENPSGTPGSSSSSTP